MTRLAAVVLLLVLVTPPGLGDHPFIVDHALFDVAYRGDLGAVEALLGAGADPNDRMDIPSCRSPSEEVLSTSSNPFSPPVRT